MTQKQTILGRIGQLARANVNALLDRAEDPEKMLDQLVRDYTNSIAEAEEAVAQTIANVRMAESDLEADQDAAQEWGRKAAAAAAKAKEMAGTDSADAQKWTDLARVALRRQLQHEQDVDNARPAIEQQNATVEQLKQGLTAMKTKLEQLKAKRGTLVARARSVEAQASVQEAMSSIDVMDPSSELSRWEQQIRAEEALVQGRAEAQATTLQDQFAELEDRSDDAEIEARLAALNNPG